MAAKFCEISKIIKMRCYFYTHRSSQLVRNTEKVLKLIYSNAYRVPLGCNRDSKFVFFVALLCNKYTRADPAPYLGMNYVIGLIKLSKYSSRLTPRGNFHIFIHWHIDRAATFMPI